MKLKPYDVAIGAVASAGALSLLLFLAFGVGCAKKVTVHEPNPALAVEIKIAQALNGVSTVCTETLNLVHQIMPQQSDDRRVIVGTIITITKANIAARRTLEAISKSPKATPQEVIAAMRPAVLELSRSLNEGLIGIKNEETRRQFRIWLVGIGAAISTARAILEVAS